MNYLWRHGDRMAIFGPQTKMRFLWYYPYFGQPPIGLHITMFCTSMKAFASDEQLEEWMPKINNFDIIGCYCQTEIGHGSDVASLKTTATLDRKTDEFVINTPSLDATKWWPGEMGRFANHALVFARLLVPDEEGNVNDYGIAPFIVQIREYKTHRHCKGIKTGDLGPKYGYSSKDNGWCTFDNVRVSRKAMLSRFTTIDKEGTFSLEGDPRVLYSTMLKTRVLIFCASHLISAACLLIAVRYSICRRQFRNISGKKEETKLLDYQTQQMKLFPQMALAWTQTISNEYVCGIFEKMLEEISKDEFGLLDIMHHFSSGFKSVQTQDTVDGCLVIRQSLGGAGYSSWSGIDRIISEYSPTPTFEGDNTVMAQ